MAWILYCREKVISESAEVYDDFAEYFDWLLGDDRVRLAGACKAIKWNGTPMCKYVVFRWIRMKKSKVVVGFKMTLYGLEFNQSFLVMCHDPKGLRDEMIDHFELVVRK